MAKSMRQSMIAGMDLPSALDEPARAPETLDAPKVNGAAPAPQLGQADRDMASPAAEECETVIGLPSSLKGETVWVVDANSLIFQVFHALPEMTSPRGEPVSAVFGFTRDMLYLLEQKKPTYLFVAFDGPERTFRHEIFDAYKAHRSEMPIDLVPQFAPIHRLLEGLGVPILSCPGYEADDLLATIAHQANELEGECYLVTADKDCRQLITDLVKVYNVRKDQMYDACALEADWGIRPDQVVDFQALVGDAVDNVPGVPLVGPKIAAEYLKQYDTLDNLLEHAQELPKGKRKENLLASRAQVLVSRDLVRLDRHVAAAIDWGAGRVGEMDREALGRLFTEMGFRTLAERFAALPQPPPESAVPLHYELIHTPERLEWLVGELGRQKGFSFDTETTSLSPRWAEIVGYSFSWRDGEAYYVPVRAPQGESHLDPSQTLESLRPILENPAIEKVGQNLKYDMIVLRAAGVRVAGARFDSMVASYLLDAGERNHNLDELAQRYLRHRTTKIGELIGSGKNQKRMDEVPLAAITHYAAEDADVVWRLRPVLTEQLKSSRLDNLFDTLEMPLVEVLVELESNGIKVDTEVLAGLSSKYATILERLEQEIHDLAGRSFNIGSPKQLQEVLFAEQKLPMLKKTKTGGSTDVEVLEELARLHPLPAKIIEYRQYSKLKGTYVDALPRLVHPGTGRVHASFNQSVAATGRLSSSDPNLQNIPIRSQTGREIRAAFLPGYPGWKLLAADYSQIELRVLAHLSGDATLCSAFERDEDIHARVASEVYGVSLDAVTSDMRRGAKAVNFGVIYGQSPFGLAKQLGIEQSAAALFIDAYFDRYRGVEEFLQRILAECPHTGYVSTILGRRRSIQGIRRGTSRQRNLPERTAINTVIQGSAADLIKLAMINVHRRMLRENLSARMLLQIHDELVFEVPSGELQTLKRLVSEEMSRVMELKVPLKVDLKSGDDWAGCQD
ncbi:MAG TPA: DNA polymerase I [Pirellulales bacterium]|jgi:DNA polymerase-1|nr:DNA polymerase I [Pirellulales bacterium]